MISHVLDIDLRLGSPQRYQQVGGVDVSPVRRQSSEKSGLWGVDAGCDGGIRCHFMELAMIRYVQWSEDVRSMKLRLMYGFTRYRFDETEFTSPCRIIHVEFFALISAKR